MPTLERADPNLIREESSRDEEPGREKSKQDKDKPRGTLLAINRDQEADY